MASRYVQETLSAGESIIFETRLHWINVIGPTIWLCIMILFIVRDAFDVGETGIVVFIFLGCFSLPALVSYATSEFTITNRRVVVKIGWLRRRTMEININKVESAGVLQGLQGRILGYGDITLTGTGGTKELLKKISRPFEFRTALINLQTRDSK